MRALNTSGLFEKIENERISQLQKWERFELELSKPFVKFLQLDNYVDRAKFLIENDIPVVKFIMDFISKVENKDDRILLVKVFAQAITELQVLKPVMILPHQECFEDFPALNKVSDLLSDKNDCLAPVLTKLDQCFRTYCDKYQIDLTGHMKLLEQAGKITHHRHPRFSQAGFPFPEKNIAIDPKKPNRHVLYRFYFEIFKELKYFNEKLVPLPQNKIMAATGFIDKAYADDMIANSVLFREKRTDSGIVHGSDTHILAILICLLAEKLGWRYGDFTAVRLMHCLTQIILYQDKPKSAWVVVLDGLHSDYVTGPHAFMNHVLRKYSNNNTFLKMLLLRQMKDMQKCANDNDKKYYLVALNSLYKAPDFNVSFSINSKNCTYEKIEGIANVEKKPAEFFKKSVSDIRHEMIALQGREFNRSNSKGDTALHQASKEGDIPALLYLLLFCDVDASLKNRNQQTAEDVAAHKAVKGVFELYRYIKSIESHQEVAKALSDALLNGTPDFNGIKKEHPEINTDELAKIFNLFKDNLVDKPINTPLYQ